MVPKPNIKRGARMKWLVETELRPVCSQDGRIR
jgi:hypothetical protein